MHNHSPLSVLLSDMHRSGVTDVTAETIFNFTEDKISKPFQNKSSEMPTPQATTTVQTQQPLLIETTKTTTAQKIKARPIDSLMWSFGEKKATIHIVLSSNLEKGVHPLSEKSKELFVKMLSSIGIVEEKSMYWVLSAVQMYSQKEQENVIESLKNRGEGARTLFIGEEATQIVFGAGVLKTRQKQNMFNDKECGILMHPDSLLAQPLLKKIAWQDLLKFQLLIKEK